MPSIVGARADVAKKKIPPWWGMSKTTILGRNK